MRGKRDFRKDYPVSFFLSEAKPYICQVIKNNMT